MVLATDAFLFETTKSPRRFHKYRQVAKLFLTHAEIPTGTRSDYLCFRSLDRADYRELFETVIGTIQSSKVIVQDFRKRRSVPEVLPLLNLLLNLHLFPRLGPWPLKTRLYLYCRVAWYTALLRKIARLRFERLVVFADMQPLDNLLVQYFPDKVSITLQHGLYVDYEGSFTINVANYRYQVADYFLAWGQNTSELIAKYHPDTKVVICGKPNLGQKSETNSGHNPEYFSVIFDQNMYEKYNFQLLRIAYEFSKQTGLKFNLKFHPWNIPKTYSVDNSYVVENCSLAGSKFVIGHTTSLLYELLRIGVPAFKLWSPERALPSPDEYQFSTSEELLVLSEREPSPESCITVGRNYISQFGTESVEKYREFFVRLNSGAC